MYEEELLEKIRQSSEEVKIPEELQPETIEKKLKRNQKRSKKWIGAMGAAAAAILMLCSAGAVYRINHIGTKGMDNSFYDGESGELASGSGEMENAMESDVSQEDADTVAKASPKLDAGNLYKVAEDYTQVYQALQSPMYPEEEEKERGFLEKIADNFLGADGAKSESAPEESVMDTAGDMGTGNINESGAAAEMDTAASKGSVNYSKTNVQTNGVDESDIIKTDGNYIYTVSGDQVIITDIREKNMKVTGYLTIGENSGDTRVVEMYVEGDSIYLVVQKEETILKQGEIQMRPADPKYTGDWEEEVESPVENDRAVTSESFTGKDSYQVETKSVTELLTYDIKDRKNPKLKGTVTQDGYYKDSRKIGSMVYLFTEGYMEQTPVKNQEVITNEEAGGFIPLVNGKMIGADCIYLPEYGEMGCVISSVDTKNSSEVVDHVLILNNHAQIYVSRDAVYLYHRDNEQGKIKTKIAKFSLNKGEINAVGAAALAGEVYDTFAVAEEKGNLRVLTTDVSGNKESNNLYLLDETLHLTGKLEGIAKGEQVYAARFLGDTAYFVTYRNTDPLFAVDLSDPTKPEILSEVKLSGFSEYLHFWGKDKLVGIGYETDEETGVQEGLKLVLFDIKDPAKVKIVKEFVIENASYSPGMYQYKTVLADPNENLLGFAMTSYQNGEQTSYLLFSVENGEFRNLLTADLEDSSSIEEYRGIYAGDRFYLASPTNLTSFNRKENYRKIQKLEY
ncbi:MAG: beta-propeller domain-containing protein [Lachnospiraceae bacterium]|nr:beta-propeller domain-containing protein [Lachnospiraceae bacterium]